jgi:hypothetical protein
MSGQRPVLNLREPPDVPVQTPPLRHFCITHQTLDQRPMPPKAAPVHKNSEEHF